MHWSDWIHSEWDCSCFPHKAAQAKTKKIYIPSCLYLVSQQYFLSALQMHIFPPSSSLIPIKSHKANMRLPKSTCQASYCYFSYSCQGVSYYFPCQGWGKTQTQECKKTSLCGAVKDGNSGGFVTVKSKQMMCFNTFIIDFQPPQAVCTHLSPKCVCPWGKSEQAPGALARFCQSAPARSAEGNTKKNPNSKTSSLWWAEFMLLCQKIPLIAQTCSFSPKHRKIPAAIDAASEDKASTNRAQLLADTGKFFHNT